MGLTSFERVVRFRHPKGAMIKSVIVNDKPWAEFDPDKETITIRGFSGTVNVTAAY